ncbi:MAG: pentapeptide repeat-containing protein [Flavobacteriaceae bacterium]|nr:pentapeptide repeat-containing protein [Flavobacteriaceae bacterium]
MNQRPSNAIIKNIANKAFGATLGSIKSFILWWSLDRLVSVATLCSILFAVFIYYEDRMFRKENTIARKFEQISSAWEVLNKRSNHDNGKSNALNILIKHKVSLNDLDLSCKTHRGINCKRNGVGQTDGVSLSGIFFGHDYRPSESELHYYGTQLNFSGSNIYLMAFHNTSAVRMFFNESSILNFISYRSDFIQSNFTNASLQSSKFAESNLWETIFYNATLEDVVFTSSSLVNADFREASFIGVQFDDLQVSKAVFTNLHIYDKDKKTTFENVWAWVDWQPIDLPNMFKVELCAFEEGKHNRLLKPADCIHTRPLPN